jgi:hypothetical protein
LQLLLLNCWQLYICPFLEVKGGLPDGRNTPAAMFAEVEITSGKVSQCHIDAPVSTNVLMQQLTAGGLAVINIPQAVMTAKATTMAAVGSAFKFRSVYDCDDEEGGNGALLVSSVGTERSVASMSFENFPIASGSPSHMRSHYLSTSRPCFLGVDFADKISSQVQPEESRASESTTMCGGYEMRTASKNDIQEEHRAESNSEVEFEAFMTVLRQQYHSLYDVKAQRDFENQWE